jgi:hypothetical protein
MKENRFQFQKWYVKLWRMRWYLLVPYSVLSSAFRDKFSEKFEWYWDIAIGHAQIRMKYWWGIEEIEDEKTIYF